MKKTLLFLFYLSMQFIFAQTYKIQHADFRITINPYEKHIEGQNTFFIKMTRRADTLVFDAHERVQVTEVKHKAGRLNFFRKDGKLFITGNFSKGKKYVVNIRFSTKNPKQALYFVGWNNGNKNQVWTQGQGKNHSHWMPFNDDINQKFTWRMQVDFPKNYEVISNGTLIQKDTTGVRFNRFIYELDKPASGYLLFVGAGRYEIIQDTVSGIPHIKYRYADAPRPDRTFSESEKIFNIMPRLIGLPFPWKQYREIPLRDFIYGGMENVTATVFSDQYVANDTAWNDRNPVYILAHELAHQWFGDWVTETSAKHHWIHESFATFYGREAEKEIFGRNYYEFANYFELQKIIDAYKNGDTVPLLHEKASSLTFYQKGALLLRMMRDRIGKENFDKVIVYFLKKNARQNVSTADFKAALHHVTGDSLNGFFAQWFEKASVPSYRLFVRNDSLIVETGSGYKIPVRLFYKNGHYQDTLLLGSIALPRPERFAFYLPDPGRRNLVALQWQLDETQLRYALRMPLSDLDFYRVLKQYRNIPLHAKQNLFLDISAWDYYYPVHSEILLQTENAGENYRIRIASNILKHGIQHRKAVAASFGTVPEKLRKDFEKMLSDLSYEMKENALYALWNSFPSKQKQYLDRTRNTYGLQDRSFRMMWIMLALNTEGYVSREQGLRLLEELTDYASPDWPASTRQTALELIDMLQLYNEKTLQYIKTASEYFYRPLRQQARKMLRKIEKSR